jgi:hypothetical protein
MKVENCTSSTAGGWATDLIFILRACKYLILM